MNKAEKKEVLKNILQMWDIRFYFRIKKNTIQSILVMAFFVVVK